MPLPQGITSLGFTTGASEEEKVYSAERPGIFHCTIQYISSPMSTNRSGDPTRESPYRNTVAAVPEVGHSLDPARVQRRPSVLSQDSQEVQDLSTTIDDYSAADILDQLSFIQELNKNLSHLVSEWKDFNSEWWSFPVPFKRRRELGRCINPEFVQLLSIISLEDERIAMPLLRFAWKAIVSRAVFLILEPYSLTPRTFEGAGNWGASQSDPVVHRAKVTRDTADRAYDANWRSLTYRLMRESHPADVEKSMKALSKSIILLLFTSISLPLQTRRPSYKKVRKECEEQVMQILKEARVLAVMIHEGVFTRKYRPFHPPFGRSIDEAIMHLEDRQDSPAPGDEVLCVTQPGFIDEGGKTPDRPFVLTRKTLYKISRMKVPSTETT